MPNFAGLTGAVTSSLNSALSSATDIAGKIQSTAQSALAQGQQLLGSMGNLLGGAKNPLSGVPSFGSSFASNDGLNKVAALGSDPSPPEDVSSNKFGGAVAIPEDLSTTHYTLFTFYAYVRAEQLTPGQKTPTLAVGLPIPANLNETLDVNYSETTLGAVAGGAEKIIRDAISAGQGAGGDAAAKGKAAGESIRGAASQAFNPSTAGVALAETIGKSVGEKIGIGGEAARDLALLNIGATKNPHLAFIFRDVPLRKHTFTYRFFPRSKSELDKLKDVIKRMKARVLPSKQDEFTFGFPDLVDVSIKSGSIGEIYKIKTCVVDNLQINYNPSGTPSFFADGHPAEVEITIQLSETIVHTREDYK